MVGVDSRVTRTLPLPVFFHNYQQLYHLHVLKIARETGQSATWTQAEDDIDIEDMERLLNANDVMIPVEIYDWMRGLGKFKDKTGYDYAPNVPLSVVPKKRRTHHDGGDFGLPGEANHNAYERCISPQVSRRTGAALLDNVQVNGRIEYNPLPNNLTPANATPTANLLGYRAHMRPLHPETLANYASAEVSWSTTHLASRIAYNPVLWSKHNPVMRGFMDKMEVRIGMPPTDKGGLSLYGTLLYDEADPAATLRRTSESILSAADLDPGSLASIAIKSYRRVRTIHAPGYCYIGENDATLPGWDNSINNSYEMEVPFAPTYGEIDLTLNERRFRREVTEGRYEMILSEVSRLSLKRN